jgi:uncharacterized protein
MTMKRIFVFLAAAALLLVSAAPALAASDGDMSIQILTDDSQPGGVKASRLDDFAELLTDAEAAVLLNDLNEASERLQFDMVVVTATETGGKTSEEYADDYFDDNGFGFGADRDGALLLVNLEEMEWWISTSGVGITAMNDDAIDQLGYELTPSLSDGEYLNGFELFIQYCEGALSPAEDAELYAEPARDPSLIAPLGSFPRLVDNADLLDEEEESLLLGKLDEVSLRQQFDVVVVTASTLDGKSPMAYADDFFDYNGYGLGADRDGALLLISMEDRDWWISTRGYGITALTDFGIEKIGDDMIDNGLSDGDYYEAFVTYVKDCDSFVTQAKNGVPVDVGTYKAPFSYVKRIGVSAFIGLIVALIVGSVLKGKMKTVRAAASANAYTRPGSLQLLEQSDVFLYNNVTKTAKPQETRSGGGSSTHTSSSGASHGGGGGKF